MRFIVILGLAFFGYWFFQKSFSNFLEKSMSIQVINRVNQPLDIYAIKVIDKDQNKFLTKHLGKVRTNHYQIDYFVLSNSNEFWVAAYNVKNKLVYLMTVNNARFRNPVMPDCQLLLKVEAIRSKGKVWKYKGVSLVGDKIMADSEWMATIVDRKE